MKGLVAFIFTSFLTLTVQAMTCQQELGQDLVYGRLAVNSVLKIEDDLFRISDIYRLGDEFVVTGTTVDYAKDFEIRISLLDDWMGSLVVSDLDLDTQKTVDGLGCRLDKRDISLFPSGSPSFQPHYLVR